jgi:hypothetical protein
MMAQIFRFCTSNFRFEQNFRDIFHLKDFKTPEASGRENFRKFGNFWEIFENFGTISTKRQILT